MAKIAMIGAGSVVFAKRLIGDILSFPELRDSTIVLMDIDKDQLDLITALAKRMVEQEGVATQIEATLDRREALKDANYVLTMILVGGPEAYELDIGIPLKYGVKQTIGDTLGPGGVFRALRTIPVMLSICKDMEELCPGAWLINYTNPMAMNCWAMNEGSRIKNVGLCHSVQGTAIRLADYIGVPAEEVSYWVAGINHMSWFLEFRWNGRDAYPLLWEKMNDPEIYARDAVRFEMMSCLGYFATESSHHMSEYVPYFLKRTELIEKFNVPILRDLSRRRARREAYYETIRRQAFGEERIEIKRTREYASCIIHSIETGSPRRINGNVRNTGLITNLPWGCCVEVPCLVDGTGIYPCYVGELPPQCAALNHSNINVQELAVRAALEGNREKAFQAILLDPLTGAVLSTAEMRDMVEEMFQAEARYLPQF